MATGNPWFNPIEQTLPTYVPLPFQEMLQAGQVVQGRYDTNLENLDNELTGLASMEAYAPAHRQFRDNYAARFKEESSNLLDKYNGRADDPNFARELKQITRKYAGDPNLATIRQANAQLQAKQKVRQELDAKGQKYLDTNPNFTGVDAQGNLVADVGEIRGVTFDDDLRQLYQDAAKGITNDGSMETNQGALDALTQNLVQGAATNPVTRQALQYYASQGYTQEQAVEQLQRDLQSNYSSNLIRKKDDMNERLSMQRANLAIAQERHAMDKMEFSSKMQQKQQAGILVPEVSPIQAKNLNESLIKDVDRVLNKGVDAKGNLQGRELTVPNTPENRAKYPNAKATFSGSGGQFGGGSYSSVLKVPGGGAIEQDDAQLLRTARETLGITGGTANKVLSMYKDYLSNDNNAPTFWNTPVAEYKKGLTDQYIGANGENLGDAVIIDRKGKAKRVSSDDINIGEYSSFNFGGITSSPVSGKNYSFDGGAIKGTAIDKDGNIVQILKPADPAIMARIPFTNIIGQAVTSGLSQEELLKDPRFQVPVGNITLAPQRVKGGVVFYEIQDGKKVGKPIDQSIINEQIKLEHNNLGQFMSQFQNTD